MKTIMAYSAMMLSTFSFATHSLADTFGSGATAFDIEFVAIGDLGNPADTTGIPNPAGSVDYEYRLGKYEISRDMVAKASAEGGLGVMLDPVSFVTGGPRPDMPATGVSWNEAARFTNWLNTSQGFPAAYKFSAEPGEVGFSANANIELWEEGDPGFDAANPFRNSQARYFLPSADEWYKAAYFDPTVNGGAGGYWDYPTGSDTAPTAVASGTDPGTVVYDQTEPQGPADITQAGGLSPYGVMGLGGNVGEWQETGMIYDYDLNMLVPSHELAYPDGSAVHRGHRGGVWRRGDNFMTAVFQLADNPPREDDTRGFRVASRIAEPSSFSADFDGDSDVDGADFLALQRAFGCSGDCPVDADGNGDTDQNDLVQWEAQFGQGAATAPAGTAAPEPVSWQLLLVGLTVVHLRRTIGRRSRAPFGTFVGPVLGEVIARD